MEAMKQFKLFLLLMVFCSTNILLYRHFSHDQDLLVNRYEGADHRVSASVGRTGVLDSRGTGVLDSRETGVLDSRETGVPPTRQQLCPVVSPLLNGLPTNYLSAPNFTVTAAANPGLVPGGLYSPPDCRARHRVAVVVPYRRREDHLKTFLHNIHPFLQRQQLEYGVYVIDQALPGRFNRAMLLNIGFVEAMRRHDYQCVVFHDVDLIPENDRNLYSCPEMPRHMSAAIDLLQYKLRYHYQFGGVSAISKDHMIAINGYSNIYFGWGGEDDDFGWRLLAKGLNITRYPLDVARYKMISHKRDSHNPDNPLRFKIRWSATKRMGWDGLNSLLYKVVKVEELPTHTKIQVLIDENLVVKDFSARNATKNNSVNTYQAINVRW